LKSPTPTTAALPFWFGFSPNSHCKTKQCKKTWSKNDFYQSIDVLKLSWQHTLIRC